MNCYHLFLQRFAELLSWDVAADIECLFWHWHSSSLTKQSGPLLSIFRNNIVNTEDNNNNKNHCCGRCRLGVECRVLGVIEQGSNFRTSQHGPDVIRIEWACVDTFLYLYAEHFFAVLQSCLQNSIDCLVDFPPHLLRKFRVHTRVNCACSSVEQEEWGWERNLLVSVLPHWLRGFAEAQ